MNSVPSTAQHSTAQHSTAQHSTAQPYLASDSFSFLRYCEPKAWRCWKAKRSPSRYFRVQSEEHRAHVIVLAGESCRFNKLSEPALDCALNNYFRTKNVENTVLKPPLEGRCPALAGRRGDLTRVKYLFSITSIINILHYLSFKRVFNNDKKDIFKILDPHKEYGLLSSIQNKLQITPNHIWRNDYE